MKKLTWGNSLTRVIFLCMILTGCALTDDRVCLLEELEWRDMQTVQHMRQYGSLRTTKSVLVPVCKEYAPDE